MMLNAKILTKSSTFHAIAYNESKLAGQQEKLGMPGRDEKTADQGGSSFDAIDYNTAKTTSETAGARFISHKNFPDHLINDLNPQKLKDYLIGWGATNTRVQHQQFHVAITCKGKEFTAEQLAQAAHLYMQKMGYSDNPYLVYFHQDTENNHVHIVSSRIGPDGKKISSDFENQRSVKIINAIGEQISGKRNITFEAAVTETRSFRFSTPAQFNMLMERSGFDMQKTDKGYSYYRNGYLQGQINHETIQAALTDPKILKQDEQKRMAQIKALIYKYASKYDPTPELRHTISPGGRPQGSLHYTSKLSVYLKDTFAIDTIFHASGDKPVYGYTLIDNVSKTVFKGSDVVSLKDLLTPAFNAAAAEPASEPSSTTSAIPAQATPTSPQHTEPASNLDCFARMQLDYTTYSRLGAIDANTGDDRKKRLKRRR